MSGHRPLVDGDDADRGGTLRDPAERRHEHLTNPRVGVDVHVQAALTEDLSEDAVQVDAEVGVDLVA
jgi:hypothetical protein